jgi:uncharacterized membrane protein
MINEPTISGDMKTIGEAYNVFSLWYKKCLQAGIEPESVVAMMGEMALITQQDTIDFLIENHKFLRD